MSWLDDQPLLARVAVCITVSLIVAGLSYRYIERPLMDGAKSAAITSERAAASSIAAVARVGRGG
jgi:peptidoglycan/LPS O-acetylase OafA/YrhL